MRTSMLTRESGDFVAVVAFSDALLRTSSHHPMTRVTSTTRVTWVVTVLSRVAVRTRPSVRRLRTGGMYLAVRPLHRLVHSVPLCHT